ncbi:MAG: serine hydrolase [Clostridia bacterium]|nr:serine hydrolase [Clostridia bacterium]
MKGIKLLAVFMVAVLIFGGCGGAKNESASSSIPENSNEPPITSAPSVSSEPEAPALVPAVTADNKTYGDLLLSMPSFGREIRAFGELEGEEYSESLSKLEKVLGSYGRNVSVVAWSLDGKRAIGYNTSAEIFCACAVKAPYTLYCCLEMEKGKATLDTEMKYEKKHYEPGTGDMQYSPYGTVFSMETMLHKSMSISDNVGYLMAVDFFGREGYNEWISEKNCPSLEIKPTVWSLRAKARDLAIAWREIYGYFSDGGEYAEFLYNSCTGTAGNYSTAALDEEYSHKQGHNRSGDWTSYTDAGIVWKEGSPYILVILTDAPGPSSYDAGVFADIAKIINNELF